MDIPKRIDTPLSVFNPLKFDFVMLQRNEHNQEEEVIVPSLEIKTFPKWLGDIVVKNLLRAIQDDRDVSYFDKKEEEKILKEILVEK